MCNTVAVDVNFWLSELNLVKTNRKGFPTEELQLARAVEQELVHPVIAQSVAGQAKLHKRAAHPGEGAPQAPGALDTCAVAVQEEARHLGVRVREEFGHGPGAPRTDAVTVQEEPT